MEERNKRKERMQELLQKNKESRKLEIEPLLKECVEVLQSNVEIANAPSKIFFLSSFVVYFLEYLIIA